MNTPTHSKMLLEQGYDRPDTLFVMARETPSGVAIDEHCPIAVRDEPTLETLRASHPDGNFISLKEARDPNQAEGAFLLSGGAFLHFTDARGQTSMPLLRRNGGAAEGFLTDANGLATEAPDITMFKEFAEECPLLFKRGNTVIMPNWTFGEYRSDAFFTDEQQEDRREKIRAAFGEAIEIMDVDLLLEEDAFAKAMLYDKEGAIAYFEEEHNTQTFRKSFSFDQRKHGVLFGSQPVCLDLEPFGREASLYRPYELKGEKLLSSLEHYVQLRPPEPSPSTTLYFDRSL